MRPLKIKTSYEVAFSPDGSTVLALGRDVSLWSINDRKKQWRVHPFSHPSNGTFSPDGKLIAVKNTAGQIVVLDAATGGIELDYKNQSEGEGSNVCFSPSGDQLIDGSWDGLLTVRSLCSKEIMFRAQFPREMVTRIHKSNTGDFFISEHHPKATTYDEPPDNCFFLKWTWPIGSVEPKRIPFNAPFVKSSALHPNDCCMAVVYGAPPSKMVLFDLSGGDIRWIQEVKHGGPGSALKWSRCGQFVGAVQQDRIAVYSSKAGALIDTRGLPYPSDVDFSPDTSLIAFGSWQEGFVGDFAPKDRIAGEGCRVTEKFKHER